MIQNLLIESSAKIANIILLTAPTDCYALLDYVLGSLQQKTKSTDNHRFNADRFFQYTEIYNLITNGSLFHDITYIEINYKSKPTAEQQKELLNLLTKIEEHTYLVITTDKLTKPELNNIWVKTITKQGLVVNLSETDLPAIIHYELQQHELTINDNALEFLLQLNEGNINQLMQELKKLTLSFSPQHIINIEEIKQHTTDNTTYNIYQLNHAYLAGNLAKSISILDNIYQKPEDAILLQWLINEDLRKLIRIKSLLKQNFSFYQISQELKLRNSNLYQAIERRISYAALINTLHLLAQLDLMVKGVINGEVKQQLIIIIRNLCNK